MGTLVGHFEFERGTYHAPVAFKQVSGILMTKFIDRVIFVLVVYGHDDEEFNGLGGGTVSLLARDHGKCTSNKQSSTDSCLELSR